MLKNGTSNGILMMINLPDVLIQSGCNRKIASSCIAELAAITTSQGTDAGAMAIAPQSLMTIDTLYAFSRNPEVFALAACEHAANDLYCLSAKPTDCSFSIQASGDDPASEVKVVSRYISNWCRSNGIALTKAHSTLGETSSLTISLCGKQLRPQQPPKNSFKVILTKPLGLSRAVYLSEKADELPPDNLVISLLASHKGIINENILKGSTDVSGFGLANAIWSACQRHNLNICLSTQSLPASPSEYCDLRLSREIETNRRDFLSVIAASFSPEEEVRLFAPQSSGPLALLVEDAEVDNVLTAARCHGLASACIIGAGRPGTPSLEVIAS